MIQKQHENAPAVKNPGRSRLSGWLLMPLSLCTIMLFVFAVQWKESLVIQKIEVEGARILAAQDVVNITNIKPQTAMYSVDLFEAQQRLLGQPMIKSATITRMFTNALRVVIRERDPYASLGGNELRYIDSECVLLPHQQTTVQFDLPVITGLNGLDTAQYGKVINDPEVAAAVDVIKAAEAIGFNHSISEVNMNNGGDIIMYSADSGIQVLLGRDGMMKKMLLLQTFWANFMKPDSLGQIKCIDARFEGQIVLKRNQNDTTPSAKIQM
jgi:cell division septal protein FtsQ